jgi:hypothetical protein
LQRKSVLNQAMHQENYVRLKYDIHTERRYVTFIN